MVALVLSACNIVGAQQITDFLPSSPDIPGFTVPTLSVFLLSPPLLPPGSQCSSRNEKKYTHTHTHTYTQMLKRDPAQYLTFSEG